VVALWAIFLHEAAFNTNPSVALPLQWIYSQLKIDALLGYFVFVVLRPGASCIYRWMPALVALGVTWRGSTESPVAFTLFVPLTVSLACLPAVSSADFSRHF